MNKKDRINTALAILSLIGVALLAVLGWAVAKWQDYPTNIGVVVLVALIVRVLPVIHYAYSFKDEPAKKDRLKIFLRNCWIEPDLVAWLYPLSSPLTGPILGVIIAILIKKYW